MNTIKPPVWRLVLCTIGLHQFEVLEDNCMQVAFCGMNEGSGQLRKCKGCTRVDDQRCEKCIKLGIGTCWAEFVKTSWEQRRRANCCVHCPDQSHEH